MKKITITVTLMDGGDCWRVEWPLPFNDHVIKRLYHFCKIEDVIDDLKHDPDYNGEAIKVIM